MKKYLLSLFGVLMIGLISGAQANAVVVDSSQYKTLSYTIKFDDSVDANKENKGISASDLFNRIAEGNNYFPSNPGIANVYFGNAKGIRFSNTNGSANGSLNWTVPAAGQKVASSIVIEASGYAHPSTGKTFDATMALSVNGTQVGAPVAVEKNTTKNYVFDLEALTKVTSLKIEAVLPFYIKSITVNYVEEKAATTLSFANNSIDYILGQTTFTGQKVTATPNVSGITYSSSDQTVATVNATTGDVTVLAKGSTTITATFSGNDDYKPASAAYAINVKSPDQIAPDFKFNTTSVTKAFDPEYAGENLYNPQGLDATYTSTVESVATVDATTGKVTLKGLGTTEIIASTNGNDKYSPATARYTINVTKRTVKLSWTPASANLALNDAFTAPTLVVEPSYAASTVKLTASGLLSVAADGKTINLKGGEDGTGKVTASIISDVYEATPVVFNLRVSDASKVEDVVKASDFVNGNYTSKSGVTYNGKFSKSGDLISIAQTRGDYLGIIGNEYGLVLNKVKFIYSASNPSTTTINIYGGNAPMTAIADYTDKIGSTTKYPSDNVEYVFRPTEGTEIRGLRFETTGNLFLEELVFIYEKVTPEYSFDKTAYSIVAGEDFTAPVLNNVSKGLTAISYSSANTNVATIDQNGVLKLLTDKYLKEEVSTTITAENAGDAIFNAHKATYTLTVLPRTSEPAGLAFSATSIDHVYGKAFTAPELTKETNAPVKYTSDKPEIAEVDSNGNVTIKGTGVVTITASTDEIEGFFAGEASYKINIAKAQVVLNWEPASAEIELNGAFNQPVLKISNADNNEALNAEAAAYVKLTATGVLSIAADGKTINLTKGEDGTGKVVASIVSNLFEADSKEFNLTVTDPTKIQDVLTVNMFSANTGSGLFTYTSNETGVTYAANTTSSNNNFRLSDAGLWITNNSNDLEISKISLVYNIGTNNGNKVTVYTSGNVETSTGNFTTVAAEFAKADDALTFTKRFDDGVKSIYLKPSAVVTISQIIVQYKKLTPVLKFTTDSYTVHQNDVTFVSPKVTGVPEGVKVTYTSNNEAAATVTADGEVTLKAKGTARITAAMEATGIYNAASAFYTLNVEEPMVEIGDLTVSINNGERKTISNEGEIEVKALDALSFSMLNADNIKVTVTDNDDMNQDVTGNSFNLSFKTAETYTVTVTATNDTDSEKTVTFDIAVSYEENKLLGDFYVNNEAVSSDEVIVADINKTVTFAATNAVNGTFICTINSVAQTADENGIFKFTPTEVGEYTVRLEATDIYGNPESDGYVEFTLNVVIPEAEILDFVNNTYGMTVMTSGNDYNGANQVLTETSFKYTVNNRTRLWGVDGQKGLRFNGSATTKGQLIVEAPEGYVITAISTLDGNGNAATFTNIATTIAQDKKTAQVNFTSDASTGVSIPGLKVEVVKIPDVEGLTPSLDEIQASKADSNGDILITLVTEPGLRIYWKQTYKYLDKRHRVVSHEGFQEADVDETGTTHTFNVKHGYFDYYAYHPESDTQGEVNHAVVYNTGEVTSIEEIEAGEESEGEVYDLQGRRIAKPTRGLFIQNGVKVLIRK